MKLPLLVGLALVLGMIPAPAVSADPYEITVSLPLTGQASFLGKEAMETLQIIEASVNKSGGIGGRPLHFTPVDDQSSPQIGLQLTTLAMARKDAIILGPSLTAVCDAVAPLFLKDGPVDYCYSPGTHPPAGGFVFGAGPLTTDAQIAAIRYFRERGWRRIAIIIATDASGQDAEQQIDNALRLPENASMSVVAREHFNPTDLSVAAQMERIKAAGPQVLIAWGTGTPEGTLLRGAQDAGIDLPIYTSAANLTYAQMKQYAGFMPKQLLFPGYPFTAPEQLAPGPTKNAVNAFVANFKVLGIRPDQGQAIGWDAAQIVIAALRKLGPDATPARIRDFILNLHGFVGIYGSYDFKAYPQRGVGVNSVVIVRWDIPKDTWVGVSKPGGLPL